MFKKVLAWFKPKATKPTYIRRDVYNAVLRDVVGHEWSSVHDVPCNYINFTIDYYGTAAKNAKQFLLMCLLRMYEVKLAHDSVIKTIVESPDINLKALSEDIVDFSKSVSNLGNCFVQISYTPDEDVVAELQNIVRRRLVEDILISLSIEDEDKNISKILHAAIATC